MGAKRSYQQRVDLIKESNPSFFENNYSIEEKSTQSGKLYVICKVCGHERNQVVESIMKGCGCSKCPRNKPNKSDTQEFIRKVLEKYPENTDKFDYSGVDYKAARYKVSIGCMVCGKTFMQTPNCHLSGKGCSHCVGRNKTTESFISEVLDKFPENLQLFDYSKVQYMNDSSKVTIGCRSCGDWFEQSAGKHLLGRGCNLCNGAGFDKQQFISQLTLLHPHLERLDFSQSEYKNYSTLIKYSCNACGDNVSRLPATLFRTGESGCSCQIHKSNINHEKGTLYLVEWVIDGFKFIKVGITSVEVYQRCYFTSSKVLKNHTYTILNEFNFSDRYNAMSAELKIKHKFSDVLRYVDKQTFPDGWTETFNPIHLPEIIGFIKETFVVQST
jgi:hypothetical protein